MSRPVFPPDTKPPAPAAATLLALGIGIALLAAACVPTLELKDPQPFTDRVVKRMQFQDACRLQAYFDKKPPQILILGERAASADGRTEAGQARVLVRPGPQLSKLGEILRRFYRDVPEWLLTTEVTVTTDFLRRIPRRGKRLGALALDRGVVVIPTTARITLAVGKQVVEAAYHPCLGELLFGRRTYALRRLILSGPPRAPRRARVAPRPDPRVAPRPDPRVVPRPDPRAAPRPDPRAVARPDPGIAPRPDPRRPALPPLPR
jgi:hypothetical protein